MTTLTYFFSPIYSLDYNTLPNPDDGSSINNIYFGGLEGDVIRINLPNNNSNQNVIIMNITEDNIKKQYFFTLNLMYLGKSKNIPNSTYCIILQGNRNDYNNDSLNQLMIMIPIMDTINNTISASTDPKINSESFKSKINTANQNLSDIINNISDKTVYNPSKPINPNNFLFNINSGTLYIPKRPTNNITTQIIILNSSELYKYNLKETGNKQLNTINKEISIPENYTKSIDIINNEQDVTITTNIEPIYIDCNPVNDNNEQIDSYTQVNPIQLNISKINNLAVWFLSFLTLFVVLLIVYLIYTLFSLPSSNTTNNPT